MLNLGTWIVNFLSGLRGRSLSEPLVDLHHDCFRCHHRDNESQDIDEVTKFNVISEDEVDDFEDNELGREQNQEFRGDPDELEK